MERKDVPVKNFMSQMLMLHLIYFPEMLILGWKYYRPVSVVTGIELPQPEPVSNQSINPHMKMEESMHSIDQGSVSKSPLTKQKKLDVYADVFERLGTFQGEPYKFKLKENYMPALDMHQERFLSIYKMTFMKK